MLCLAWEMWLAPLRPGGSLLALKALPLSLAIPGVLNGRRYTYQWSLMLILAYFAEGVTRAWSERGPVADARRRSRLRSASRSLFRRWRTRGGLEQPLSRGVDWHLDQRAV